MRTALILLAALAAGAQEPTTMGLTLRGSRPSDNLKDMVGGKAGFGISLDAESEIQDAWRARLVLGYDAWGPGSALDRSGVQGKVTVGHVSLEGVRMLGAEQRDGFFGPYFVFGLGAYGWNASSTDPVDGLAVTRRVIHLGGSLGLGYRFSKSFDAEIRVNGGKIDPQFTATAMSFGITYRY